VPEEVFLKAIEVMTLENLGKSTNIVLSIGKDKGFTYEFIVGPFLFDFI
jgi:hypothetical protein